MSQLPPGPPHYLASVPQGPTLSSPTVLTADALGLNLSHAERVRPQPPRFSPSRTPRGRNPLRAIVARPPLIRRQCAVTAANGGSAAEPPRCPEGGGRQGGRAPTREPAGRPPGHWQRHRQWISSEVTRVRQAVVYPPRPTDSDGEGGGHRRWGSVTTRALCDVPHQRRVVAAV